MVSVKPLPLPEASLCDQFSLWACPLFIQFLVPPFIGDPPDPLSWLSMEGEHSQCSGDPVLCLGNKSCVTACPVTLLKDITLLQTSSLLSSEQGTRPSQHLSSAQRQPLSFHSYPPTPNSFYFVLFSYLSVFLFYRNISSFLSTCGCSTSSSRFHVGEGVREGTAVPFTSTARRGTHNPLENIYIPWSNTWRNMSHGETHHMENISLGATHLL